MRGVAERAPEYSAPDQSEQYLAKYRDAIAQVAGSVRMTKVRGF